MEVEITTMSKNGQVVIPAEIRREAKLKPSAKFLVFNSDGTIYLKRIEKKDLVETIDLVKRLDKSEADIENNRVTRADTKMPEDEIDDLLMGD